MQEIERNAIQSNEVSQPEGMEEGKIVLTLSQTTNFGLFQTERVCSGQF